MLLCPHCKENCYRANKLVRHLRDKECPSQYKCGHCDMAFRITYDLLAHEKDVHMDVVHMDD